MQKRGITEEHKMLERYKKELAECDTAIRELEIRRTKLCQTIGALSSLIGVEVEAPVESTTDAILKVLQAAKGEFLKTAEIVSRLNQMGIKAYHDPVVTMLSRLRQKKLIVNQHGSGYAIANRV